ncbi:Zinc finger and BTB domain-containing protein 16-A [Merluccius polli]|uniref:Zinc finger and BTB domain-containing protein 16-A n=1 Tax=Merluccius polli TaxID=89951 RepID=A0AA47N0F6_MERPO|nr:Zinc finger and BTB domain-containing protein 16-A [Merluccius polli]
MGVLQLHNPAHPGALLRRANQMRLSGTLCDVIITVDGQEFPAHRTVLACTSKMFEILFHRSSLRYALDFLSPKTFQQILEYAYTASLQATAEDLDDLLYAAEILEIEYLEEQCLKVLETIQAEDRMEEAGGRHHPPPLSGGEGGGGGGGGGGGDQGSRARHWRHVLMSKKHSLQEERNCTTPTALHHLALYHMAERGMAEPNESQQEAPGSGPPGKEIHMEPLSPRGPSPTSIQNPFMDLARTIKSESMQVDHPDGGGGGGGHSSSGGGGAEGSCASDRPPRDEGPGTPLRGSVITSARELHTGPDGEGGPAGNPLDPAGFPGAAEKHLASLYSGMSGVQGGAPPVSVSAVAPAGLGVPLDPRAYGGLLHQGLLHRELLSRLGQFAAGMTREGPAQLCCGECGLQLHSRQALDQHR